MLEDGESRRVAKRTSLALDPTVTRSRPSRTAVDRPSGTPDL
jgi:hypothetical protein